MNFKTKALIIKSRKLNEADKILTAVNVSGAKIEFIGKGASRVTAKMSGYLNLFNYLDLIIAEGKNLDIVTSAENIKSFKNIETDLVKTGIAFLVAEVLDKLLQLGEEHYNLMNLTLSCYNFINQNPAEISEKVIGFFLINILEKIGLKPELEHCVNCDNKLNPKDLYFSYEMGGLICAGCLGKGNTQKISENEVKILRIYLNIGKNLYLNNLKPLDILKKIDDNLDDKINVLLLKYIDYNTERRFLSASFLEKIERLKNDLS